MAAISRRLGPHSDQAAGLKGRVRLQGRRHADILLLAELPHGRHALARPQRSGRDHSLQRIRQFQINGLPAIFSRESHGGSMGDVGASEQIQFRPIRP